MNSVYLDENNLNNCLEKIIFYKIEIKKILENIINENAKINTYYKSLINSQLLEEQNKIEIENYKILCTNIDKYLEVIFAAITKYQEIMNEAATNFDDITMNLR